MSGNYVDIVHICNTTNSPDCCIGTTIHIVPTEGFTKLRQTSNLNETQVLSNTSLLRCKSELNNTMEYLDKHNIYLGQLD